MKRIGKIVISGSGGKFFSKTANKMKGACTLIITVAYSAHQRVEQQNIKCCA